MMRALVTGFAAGLALPLPEAFFGRDPLLVERPRLDRWRRCTLPMTAFLLTPPSCAAIWLALRPSAQSFVKSSTRSSVHMGHAPSPVACAIGIQSPARASAQAVAPHLRSDLVRRTKSCFRWQESNYPVTP